MLLSSYYSNLFSTIISTHPIKVALPASHSLCLFKKCFFKIINLFLERYEEREKKKERNIDVREIRRLVASHMTRIRDLAHNPGMCPDWEWNY